MLWRSQVRRAPLLVSDITESLSEAELGVLQAKGRTSTKTQRQKRETKEAPGGQGSEGEGTMVTGEVGEVSQITQSDKQ